MPESPDPTTLVGLPTLLATFAGPQDPQAILAALQPTGQPLDDVAILLRPAGTDVVEDLRTGERAAGQSDDARRLTTTRSTTLVLLHPDPARAAAVQAALAGLGAEQIEYAPETVYTGAQSVAEAAATEAAAAQELQAELSAAAPPQKDPHP